MYMRLHTKLYVASENFIYLFEVDSRQFLSGCYQFLEFILLSSTFIGENILFIYHLYIHRGKTSDSYARCRSLASRNE
jgi:hypothetical protein